MSNLPSRQKKGCRLAVLLCVLSLPSQPQQGHQNKAGYLPHDGLPDFSHAVPWAPKDGDERDQADHAIFKQSRAWEGTARWKLAQQDNDLSVTGLLHAFSCALGIDTNIDSLPALRTLLERIAMDSGRIDDEVKRHYARLRPFLVQSGPICIDRSLSLTKSFDYPSGHTTLGWLTGLVLADLVPQRASLILARARAYGESRWICGVHNISAVDEGRTLGSAVFAALSAAPEFRSDMEKARAELSKALDHSIPQNTNACIAEAKLIAVDPYTPQAKGDAGQTH